MDEDRPLSLFAGYGIELEYMIVDRESLSVLPVADEVLRAVAGDYVSEVERGRLCWSNELVLHVIELKTNGPAPSLTDLPGLFNADVARINALLEPLGGCLMPGAMHPWMDPCTETRLWPHEYSLIYEAYNRIFGCQGHGWSNLQSIHINLPFADEGEFERLHAAIRLALPLLPALAASSPITEGRFTGLMDTRLEAYRGNARRIPSIAGKVIPETVTSRLDYQARILAPMYRDIAPLNPEGTLQHEWLNSRGAIARFDRNTIEIRVLDIQECPLADLSTAAAIVAMLRALVSERWTSLADQQALDTGMLASIFLAVLREAEQAIIREPAYLASFGFPSSKQMSVGELWQHLVETVVSTTEETAGLWTKPLDTIVHRGCLARRITGAVGGDLSGSRLVEVYRELCACLAEGRLFETHGPA